jgi:hypothetical protein
MGTTLKLIDGIVEHTVDKYVKQCCKQVATHRDGWPIFGCESGIFAKAATNRSHFEHGLGLEWLPRDTINQFGPWLFYSAKIPSIDRLLQDSGINTSI